MPNGSSELWHHIGRKCLEEVQNKGIDAVSDRMMLGAMIYLAAENRIAAKRLKINGRLIGIGAVLAGVIMGIVEWFMN